MGNKKSFNPFKLWGSYVGSLVFFFLIPYPAPVIGTKGFSGIGLSWIIQFFSFGPEYIIGALLSLLFLIIGFFVGYGTHILIRMGIMGIRKVTK